MSRILLAALAFLVIPVLLALATALRGALARLVRTLLLLIVTVIGLLGLGTGITGLEKGQSAVFVVGVAIALLCLGFGLALSRGWRQPQRSLARRTLTVPATAEPDSPWTEFEASLDWVARKQVSRSRATIDAFMAERNSSSLTPAHRALLLSCERRVPQMVETCVARCRRATARERNRYIDDTIARLGQIADEAEQARRDVRAADDQQLEVLHRYFDEVAPRKDGQRREP